jgi:hypothetical protein
MASATIAANATAIAGVDAVVVAAAVASATIAVNALKAQPSAMRTPKHALRAKMAATAEVQNAAIAMVNVASELSAVNAVKMPTPMATMLPTLKMSMLKSLIQVRLTRAMNLAQKELPAEKAGASAAMAAENVAIAVAIVATTTMLVQITPLKTPRISGLPKLS